MCDKRYLLAGIGVSVNMHNAGRLRVESCMNENISDLGYIHAKTG